jgi:hypothetical protein
MSSPPRGGPATVNGILYQMLWSMLRALRMHVRECDRSPSDNSVERAVLILEPREGGGDVQEQVGRRRIVEQLKAKPGGGTWSLTAVVKEVLPDLYLARDPAFPETEYRFVTEGRMGRWGEVYRFLQGLKARGSAGADLLGRLDDRKLISFQHGTVPAGSIEPPFWPLAAYTEKSLFERIVEEVRKRQAVRDAETLEQTRQGVWELLTNFTFVPDKTMDAVRNEVDTVLLALVVSKDELGEKRQAMLTGLAEQATHGGAQIEAQAFLRGYFLDVTPLTAWAGLRRRAVEYLEGDLRRAGYAPDLDVRTAKADELARTWLPVRPLLAIAGDSGVGKSWLLYALARQLTAGEGLVILIEARGDGDSDCQRAADLFWTRIKGNEDSRSLERTAARRRELVHPHAEAWLTLLIDGVRSHQEARQLAKLPWEEWQIRLACTCLPEVARTLKAEARDRCLVHGVEDFSLPELHGYLDVRLEGAWGGIPHDVRQTLRRPLLARLYCELAPPEGWVPANEYELYNRCWGRLREGEQGDHPLDMVPLQRLALGVLNGDNYPWTVGQLHAAGVSDDVLSRLCRAGWLQPALPSHYQVWHDRLLNWAVAEAVCEQYQTRALDLPGLCTRLRQLFSSPSDGVARPLGYVPMDVAWLLADPGRNATEAVEDIIEALEVGP